MKRMLILFIVILIVFTLSPVFASQELEIDVPHIEKWDENSVALDANGNAIINEWAYDKERDLYVKLDEQGKEVETQKRSVEENSTDSNSTSVTLEVGTPRVKEKLDKDSSEENFVTIFNKDEYANMRRNIISGSEWLFEMLQASDNTDAMVDVVKYILYKATENEKFEGVEINWADILNSSGMTNASSSLNGTGFWWPVGSIETETIDGKLYAKGEPALGKSAISRAGMSLPVYGLDTLPYGTHEKPEGENATGAAIDIGAGGQSNKYYVISIGNGTVTKIQNGNMEDGDKTSAVGNCVTVNYNGLEVRYMHMYKGSIQVEVGDTVTYGQVIGKIGNSGDSTGAHLHVDMKINGQFVDATQYIEPDNSRPVTSTGASDSLTQWLWNLEGGSKYITSEGWIVFNPGGRDNTMNLAYGMVIAWSNGADSWYPEIIPGKVTEGDIVSEEQALKIWEIKINGFGKAIDEACMKNNVTLNTNQKDALISFIYRKGTGFAGSIVSAYANGGEKGLWAYMKEQYDTRSEYIVGTKKRVAEEFELFINGDYVYDSKGTEKYDKFCIEY